MPLFQFTSKLPVDGGRRKLVDVTPVTQTLKTTITIIIQSCTSLPMLVVEGENTPPQSPPLPPTLPLPYLLWHDLRLASLLGVTQSRHASFNFPPQRLLGGPQGGHPACCHANNQLPTNHEFNYEANCASSPTTAPAEPVAKHPGSRSLTSGSTTHGRKRRAQTQLLARVTRLWATFHMLLIHFWFTLGSCVCVCACLSVTSPHTKR